jgi:RNA polymerase sigma factor (sigma-70 family)
MIAEEAGVDLDLAKLARGPGTGEPLSLDSVRGETGTEFTLMETLADSGSLREFSQAEVDTILSPLIERLPPRQRQVIQKRFFENLSAAEIGKALGISGSRVQQIELQAIRWLRKEVMLRHGGSFRISNEAA